MKTREIAELVGGELVGNGEVEITSVAALDSAREGQLAFADSADTELGTAGCVLVPPDFGGDSRSTVIRVTNPKLLFTVVAKTLHPAKDRPDGTHATSVVSPTAQIGSRVFIGAFVCVGDGSVIGDGTHLRAGAKVGDNVRIGQNCVLHPNVFVEDGCTIGENVILHAGVVIGAPGFGYVPDDTGAYQQFPQIGTVVIEDKVEIGANTCIDRGALGETRVGAGTKIDNLVQIAHNVQVGKRVVIAAQTGISGSTIIEDDCVIGGQVGMGDHATVKSGAIIGSQAGVLPGKIVRAGVWWGTPVQPLDDYKRQNAHLKGLGRLKDEVKRLRERVDRDENGNG
ncbi:MAG TPA: UDP-3-O-(3-hydroxymyristoyl)glucosamine N-acyltransferase [Pyrinomonadaceae bacterium]|nr:UDP-3-O-(3-hydroxymyristoyl)glucosamine N-acyltransferase [Pyrinomonadaceae bacterium]